MPRDVSRRPVGPVRVRWRRPTHLRGPQRVAVAAGQVVAHERGTRLVGLDAATGAPRWDVPLGTWPRSVVATDRRCWALPQDRPELACLDLGAGSALWRAAVPPFSGHLVVAGDTMLVGGWRGYTALRAFDGRTGDLRWARPGPVPVARPVVAGGRVLLARPGTPELSVLDLDDGGEVFRRDLPEPFADPDDRPAFATLDADHVLVRCGPRSLWRVHVGSGDAVEFFRGDVDLSPDAPVVSGDLACVRDRGAGLTAVDAGTGRPRWRLDADGDPPVGGVVRTENGHLVARRSGILVRVDDDGEIHGRATAGRRLDGVRALTPGGVLLTGPGELSAVTPP
ncbi:PQQ-binding-like beta-propeller repeat protein [Micromonospora sediminicola]|uniref:outer membrane protein assembly factor BamB family protein n=1 Tax=Micromonospora sediminicola TaxID=946078 RepID=UPI0033DDC21F